MIPVNQTIVSVEDGDCTRACLASILDLPIDAVPNFMRFGAGWFKIFWALLRALDYEYYGTGWVKSENRPHGHILSKSPNIKGYVIASVPSKTFRDTGHSVVMNLKGLVVHDPNPNKLWEKINVLKSGELEHWMMIGKDSEEKGQTVKCQKNRACVKQNPNSLPDNRTNIVVTGKQKINKMTRQGIFCEAMNSFGQWVKVCRWHDGSNNMYPNETWDLFSQELNEGSTAWKKVRMIKKVNGKIKVLKTKNKKE